MNNLLLHAHAVRLPTPAAPCEKLAPATSIPLVATTPFLQEEHRPPASDRRRFFFMLQNATNLQQNIVEQVQQVQRAHSKRPAQVFFILQNATNLQQNIVKQVIQA